MNETYLSTVVASKCCLPYHAHITFTCLHEQVLLFKQSVVHLHVLEPPSLLSQHFALFTIRLTDTSVPEKSSCQVGLVIQTFLIFCQKITPW